MSAPPVDPGPDTRPPSTEPQPPDEDPGHLLTDVEDDDMPIQLPAGDQDFVIALRPTDKVLKLVAFQGNPVQVNMINAMKPNGKGDVDGIPMAEKFELPGSTAPPGTSPTAAPPWWSTTTATSRSRPPSTADRCRTGHAWGRRARCAAWDRHAGPWCWLPAATLRTLAL